MFLNYEIIKPEGVIRAEVQTDGAVPRHTFANCVPMTGDSVGEKATWSTGTVIPVTPAATVSLQMENARVYAYEVRGAE